MNSHSIPAELPRIHRLMAIANMSNIAILSCWSAVAILAFSYDIGADQFWFDEVITVNATQLSWNDLIWTRYWQAHSPLYFSLVKVLLDITGASTAPWVVETTLRLFSAICAVAAGALLMHALLYLRQRWAALVFGALWVCWPLVLRYAHEARPYALLLFFTALAVWGALIVLDGAKGRAATGEAADTLQSTRLERIALYASAVGSIGAALTIPLGVVVVAAVEIAALLTFGFRRVPRYWLIRCVIVWPVSLAVLLAFVPAMMHKAANYWADSVRGEGFSIKNAALVLKRVYAPGMSVLFLAIAGGLIAYRVSLRKASKDSVDKWIWLFFGAGALLIPFFLVAASTNTSVLIVRYFLPTLCFALPALALLMVSWETLPGRVLSAMAGIIVIISAVEAYTAPPNRFYAELKALMDKQESKSLVIYTEDRFIPYTLAFYLGSLQPTVYFGEATTGWMPASVQTGRPDGASPFWVIQSRSKFVKAGKGAPWVDDHRQCTFNVQESYVATLVVTDAEQLRPYPNCRSDP